MPWQETMTFTIGGNMPRVIHERRAATLRGSTRALHPTPVPVRCCA